MLEEYPAIVNTKGSIMSQTMVEARAVRKDVASAEGTLSILHDVSLRVLSGESLAITGPSGSGKSTLLRSEERRVGKECTTSGGGYQYNRKKVEQEQK